MDRSNQITKLIEFYNMKPKISRPIPTINYLKALTDYECKSICNKLKIRLVGVYMKDELKAPLKEGNYIINLQNHNEHGTHWTSFIKHRNDIYYHDSFGVIMPQNEYDIFLLEHDNIYYKTMQKQDLDAVSCGSWCIYFLYYIKNTKGPIHKRFESFNKLFSKGSPGSMKKNEQLLLKIFKEIYFLS
jgi:hypothetical protein